MPAFAVGWIATWIVPVWPGLRVSGAYPALGSTAKAQKSPVLDATVPSNWLPTATAPRFTEPVVGPAPNGPRSSGTPKNGPGATSGAVSVATALLPEE